MEIRSAGRHHCRRIICCCSKGGLRLLLLFRSSVETCSATADQRGALLLLGCLFGGQPLASVRSQCESKSEGLFGNNTECVIKTTLSSSTRLYGFPVVLVFSPNSSKLFHFGHLTDQFVIRHFGSHGHITLTPTTSPASGIHIMQGAARRSFRFFSSRSRASAGRRGV